MNDGLYQMMTKNSLGRPLSEKWSLCRTSIQASHLSSTPDQDQDDHDDHDHDHDQDDHDGDQYVHYHHPACSPHKIDHRWHRFLFLNCFISSIINVIIITTDYIIITIIMMKVIIIVVTFSSFLAVPSPATTRREIFILFVTPLQMSSRLRMMSMMMVVMSIMGMKIPDIEVVLNRGVLLFLTWLWPDVEWLWPVKTYFHSPSLSVCPL